MTTLVQETAATCRPLITFGRFGWRSGSRHDLVRTRIDDPAHAARLEELSEREAAEEALCSREIYLCGRISWLAKLGMFAATAPAGLVQRFLGYHPRLETAQRAIRTFETAAGLGPPRRSHKKKSVREET